MGDMEALRAILPRHALRDHSQPRLRRGEVRIARLAAKAARGAGEDHRPAPQGNEPPGGLAADKKPAETADAPEILEQFGRELAEIDPSIVAGVGHVKICWVSARQRRHSSIEEPY